MVFVAKMNAAGKVAIPAELRRELGLSPGDTLVFERQGAALRVIAYDANIREIQEWASQFAVPGVLASDELIADRRADYQAQGQGRAVFSELS